MGHLGLYTQRTRLRSVYGDFHLRDEKLVVNVTNVKKPLDEKSGFLLCCSVKETMP